MVSAGIRSLHIARFFVIAASAFQGRFGGSGSLDRHDGGSRAHGNQRDVPEADLLVNRHFHHGAPRRSRGIVLETHLGWGNNGSVWTTDRRTALKVQRHASPISVSRR